MKLLFLYSCLLAALFQVIVASSSPTGRHATLKSSKSSSMAKPVAGKLVKRRKPQNKHGTSSVVSKEDRSKLSSEILPEVLVEIVIGYFKDDTYPVLVSAHSWLLKGIFGIAVDSARLYAVTSSEGVKGLSHSSASLKNDERRYLEFGGPQQFYYGWFNSSHDGRCISFGHEYQASTSHGKQTKCSTKWFAQDVKPEPPIFKRVAFDCRDLSYGLLSRNGQIMCAYSRKMNVTRVYQIREEAGRSPTAVMKFKLNGKYQAVSGNGSRAILTNAGQLEIHDVGVDASKLVCQISAVENIFALNEDGSEAAFVNYAGELRVMTVEEIVGGSVDQAAIVTVIVPESSGKIHQLVYSDSGKLHVLHRGGSVSLFDPSTKALVPIEVPQEKQDAIDWAISPNADYIATLQRVDKEGASDGKRFYRTIVKRKPTKEDWRNLFGCEANSAAR